MSIYRAYELGAGVPKGWRDALERQSLVRAARSSGEVLVLNGWGLPEKPGRELRHTLLEEMAWALWCCPDAVAAVLPLGVSLRRKAPPRMDVCRGKWLHAAVASPGLALWWPYTTGVSADADPPLALQAAARRGRKILVCTRALLEETSGLDMPQRMGQRAVAVVEGTEKVLRSRFTGRATAMLPDGFRAMISTAQLGVDVLRGRTRPDPDLARRKQWECVLPDPGVGTVASRPDGRKRIWMALHWLDVGGAEKFAVDLINALPQDRYAIHVTTDVPSANPWEERIAKRVEEVVHLPAFLSRQRSDAFLEHYVRSRGIDLIHIHHSHWAYSALKTLKRFHRVPAVDTLHIIELPPHAGGYPELSCSQYEPFIDAHHVVSDHLRRFLSERWRVQPRKILLAYLNVDDRQFDPARVPRGTFRAGLNIGEDAVVVAFVGRFVKQKRPDAFLRMAGLLLDRWREEGLADGALRFVMAGDGPLRREIEKAASEAGLSSSIAFVGNIADPRPLYRDSDAVALCSENEGLALVAYEAMAMGTAVVSTDVGGQSELVDPGMLVPPGEDAASAMADALWPLVVDRRKAVTAGAGARRLILGRHRWADTVEAIEGLYRKLLDPIHGGG